MNSIVKKSLNVIAIDEFMLYKYNNNNEIIAIIIGELIAISFKSLIYLLLQRYFFTIIKIINKTCIAKKHFLNCI